ncbi:MAG: FHA domain-containing protein [Planctomycetaceae bacterium]|nr:FHA domain-containing protein [Planctomycetaceae bacterium]MCB9950439.1 FHA domain-containing protein [Planctomycetaceae bacterium]
MAIHILEIESGKYKGRRVKVSQTETVIGRDENAKIRIASEEVSRQHCILTAEEGGIRVRDLESSNGTFINGRPIKNEALLQPGQSLTVGPMTFRLLGDSKPSEKSAQPVKVPKGGAQEESALDDDIASWLSEDTPSLNDTTIIKAGLAGDGSGDTSIEIPVSNLEGAGGKRKDFKSTAEEAQDIIARWQESQRDR